MRNCIYQINKNLHTTNYVIIIFELWLKQK